MKRMAVLAEVVLIGACGPATPRSIRTGEVCLRCGRVIFDPHVAAQTVNGRVSSSFRNASCLAAYLVDHPDERTTAFVTDYPSGALILATTTIFVPVVNTATATREWEYAAYRDRFMAAGEAIRRHTNVITWDAVLALARQEQSVTADLRLTGVVRHVEHSGGSGPFFDSLHAYAMDTRRSKQH